MSTNVAVNPDGQKMLEALYGKAATSVLCPKCAGTGTLFIKRPDELKWDRDLCDRCFGTGER